MLFGASLAGMIGNTGLLSVLPALGRSLHLPDLLIATATSLSAFLFALANPYWARRVDSIGAKRCILISLVVFVLTMLVNGLLLTAASLGWVSSLVAFAGFVICRAIYGWCGAGSAPASQVYMAAITTVAERTGAMSFLASAIALGTILGPALSPLFILPLVGLSGPLYVYGLVGLATLWFIASKLPELPRHAAALDAGQTVQPPAVHTRLKWRDPRIFAWLMCGLMSNQVQALLSQALTFYVIDLSGRAPAQAQSQVGLVLMTGAVASLIGQWGIIPRFRVSPKSLVVWGALLSAAGCIGVVLAHGMLMLAITFGVASMGFSLSRPGYMAGASLAVGAQEQAAAAGMVGSLNGYVYILGPIVGMLLYGVWHPLPFLISAVALLGSAAYAFRALQ